MSRRRTFATDRAPAPIAAYSQAARIGSLVAIAGQVGVEPDTGDVPEGVAAQTRQCLRNLDAVLGATGCGRDDVLRMDCYVTSEAHLPDFNAAYAEWFGADPPARTTVIVGLAAGLLVEVTALAVAPRSS